MAISILNEAYKKCNRSNDALAAQLCCQMAEYEASLHDFDSAIRHYKVAISHCEGNVKEVVAIQISLSKLYLQVCTIKIVNNFLYLCLNNTRNWNAMCGKLTGWSMHCHVLSNILINNVNSVTLINFILGK